jgi:uncharacterized protein DUF3237
VLDGADRVAAGPRIEATLVMPGVELVRVGPNGIRRPDLGAQLVTDDGDLVRFRYDVAVIRSTERFMAALAAGEATEFDDQYMRMAPQFEVGGDRYAWLPENLFLGQGA